MINMIRRGSINNDDIKLKKIIDIINNNKDFVNFDNLKEVIGFLNK